MVDPATDHEVAGRVGPERPGGVVCTRLPDGQHGVEEQTGLLGGGQPGEQIRDPLLRGQPWILERIQDAIAVEVPVDHSAGTHCTCSAHRYLARGQGSGAVRHALLPKSGQR
jgi:hypothetical protein